MNVATLLKQYEAEQSEREEALAELTKVHEQLGEVLVRLGAKTAPRKRRKRTEGRGVTKADVGRWVSELRAEDAQLSASDVMRGVVERAKASGKTGLNLVGKLVRSVLEEDEPVGASP